TGKGFFLFFWFSAVGHGFSLLIIEEGRGWKRMEEDGKRRKEEAGGDRGRLRKIGKRGWLCALGAEHVETTMAQKRAQEEGADGAGRGPQVMMVEAG
ncbi:MAG: hypothetical protein ACI3X8_06205, partial [Alloprevotella sp.]